MVLGLFLFSLFTLVAQGTGPLCRIRLSHLMMRVMAVVVVGVFPGLVAEGERGSTTTPMDHVEAIDRSPVANESIPFFILGDFGGASGSMHHGASNLILHVLPHFVCGVGRVGYLAGIYGLSPVKQPYHVFPT